MDRAIKTTLDIPDELFKKAKARAALADLSLKDFVCGALREKLSRKRPERGTASGWRAVFGRARAQDVAEADRAMEAAFERIDPAEWE
ncbi:hypothetical protein BH20VER3_BH20VER3_23780 [soil metagenome]